MIGMKKKTVKKIFYNLLLAVLALIWLVPIIWLFVSSFSSYTGINVSKFFPESWTIANYTKLFTGVDTVAQFPAWFKNTFLIACATCVISTAFVLMVAYAMSCCDFKARRGMMNFGVILNLFPGVLSMIAIYFILKFFDLTNNHIGLIIVYSAGSGLGYLICKGFFDTVPKALRESAKLDGASEFRVFWQIVMPLSKPIIVYTVINSFLGPWMDFVMARLILNNGVAENWTVAIGLYQMLDKELINNYFTQFCAGGVLVAIPIGILFVIMQKFYVEGVAGGSVKG